MVSYFDIFDKELCTWEWVTKSQKIFWIFAYSSPSHAAIMHSESHDQKMYFEYFPISHVYVRDLNFLH